jgi:hypothetical protein
VPSATLPWISTAKILHTHFQLLYTVRNVNGSFVLESLLKSIKAQYEINRKARHWRFMSVILAT